MAGPADRSGDGPAFLSLFAGIGGFDLGFERAGLNCVGQVELDRDCLRVLAHHWPLVPRHDDVRTFLGRERCP
jgi:DNA (cytosine-5)-methyltransferase 1